MTLTWPWSLRHDLGWIEVGPRFKCWGLEAALTWTVCCCLGIVWSDTLKHRGSFRVSTSSRLQHCSRERGMWRQTWQKHSSCCLKQTTINKKTLTNVQIYACCRRTVPASSWRSAASYQTGRKLSPSSLGGPWRNLPEPALQTRWGPARSSSPEGTQFPVRRRWKVRG